MDPLERQLRRSTRSWKATIGTTVTSALLFLAMGATSFIQPAARQTEEPPLTFAYLPPPPPVPPIAPLAPRKSSPLLASNSLAGAFRFDPTAVAPAAPIRPDLLDVTLDPNIDPGVAVEVDLLRTFEVQKPEARNRLIIFNRDQVDEIPVWLYGSQPRFPGKFDSRDWSVLVLYSVSERGVTGNIHVLDATDPALVEPVKEAIKAWRFRAARKDGKPVRIWVQQPVTYEGEFKSPFTL